ncbi:hypothetical protein FACS1894218_1260 [Bacilli bacterium]|nr:hypothetical protein FACS1894218_1260 [Bacilli bacterium]
MTLGIVGSVIGSFGIGTFFAFPYLVPAQIAAEETQKTGKHNSAMFYGVQGTLVAISSALNDPVWFPLSHIGQHKDVNGEIIYNQQGEIGPHIVIYIILSVCVGALIASFFLPQYFKDMGKERKQTTTITNPTN